MITVTGKVYKISKKYSKMGNAQYQCIIIDNFNHSHVFSTKANSSWADYLPVNWGKEITIQLQQTRGKFYLESIYEKKI